LYISPIKISTITDNKSCYSEIPYPHVNNILSKCVEICFQFYQHNSSLIKDVFLFHSHYFWELQLLIKAVLL